MKTNDQSAVRLYIRFINLSLEKKTFKKCFEVNLVTLRRTCQFFHLFTEFHIWIPALILETKANQDLFFSLLVAQAC